jgi:hypothetical protein
VAPAAEAAFSPDGESLAVQSDLDTWIINRDGQRLRKIDGPNNFGLVPRAAWSPDGRLLAMRPAGRWRDSAPDPNQVRFVDTTAPDRPVPRPISTSEFLGWRSADRILVLTPDYGISEVPLAGGDPVVLTRSDPGHSCEYHMQPCLAIDVRVATALLPTLTVSPGDDPDRGPWPRPYRQAVAVLALLGAGLVALVLLGLRRRRTRRGPVDFAQFRVDRYFAEFRGDRH